MLRPHLKLLLILFLSCTATAHAFSIRTHHLTAAITWSYLSPDTQAHIAVLLKNTPKCLQGLWKKNDAAVWQFIYASGFADLVRSDYSSCPQHNHPQWHYINQYWGSEDLPVKQNEENIIRAMEQFYARWQNKSATAVDLAWLIHLAADIHQPLHVSSRVDAHNPSGDAGGNGFALEYSGKKCKPCKGVTDLHSYWDRILDFNYRKTGNRDQLFKDAQHLDNLYRLSLQGWARNNSDFRQWAMEGYEITQKMLYPIDLPRGGWPSDSYQKMAAEIAGKRVVLAAQRLAALLNAKTN